MAVVKEFERNKRYVFRKSLYFRDKLDAMAAEAITFESSNNEAMLMADNYDNPQKWWTKCDGKEVMNLNRGLTVGFCESGFEGIVYTVTPEWCEEVVQGGEDESTDTSNMKYFLMPTEPTVPVGPFNVAILPVLRLDVENGLVYTPNWQDANDVYTVSLSKGWLLTKEEGKVAMKLLQMLRGEKPWKNL